MGMGPRLRLFRPGCASCCHADVLLACSLRRCQREMNDPDVTPECISLLVDGGKLTDDSATVHALRLAAASGAWRPHSVTKFTCAAHASQPAATSPPMHVFLRCHHLWAL